MSEPKENEQRPSDQFQAHIHAGFRESFRSVLETHVARKEQELNGLRALVLALPLQLPPEADEALCRLLWAGR